MRQDFAQLGHDVMATLLDVLSDAEVQPPHRAPQLVVRQSTGRRVAVRHPEPLARATSADGEP